MRKKLLTVGLAVLMAISLTSCKSSAKTQTIKEDTYKNYKTYSFKNNFTYKVPKKWRFEKNKEGTYYHYIDPEDNTKGIILKRRVYFMGRWIKHGGKYPELLLRIFRTGYGFCEQKLMDEHMILSRCSY